ncbi:Rap1a/Tai family immunity protein [uncultured Salipiger sp.]|uniref:Rap1a/Tai family immunity protein n=1 Tax=uncultured Salipiger sp. TaxID=499810 RepID=UPI002596AD2B|nr:Rap1a/Tai family immunity protein [uncultured Salipiger sp.]
MTHYLRVLALFAGLVSPVAASAEFRSGNDLLALCSSESTVDQAVCLGFISGVHDTILTAQGLGLVSQAPGTGVCVPQGVDGVVAGQVQDIVVRHLETHPEKRHFTAANIAWQALFQAFPCL